MDQYCYFHPDSPAKWRCDVCHKQYDNACLPDCNEKIQQASCPLCQKPLVFLPAEASSEHHIYPIKRIFTDTLDSQNIGLILTAICVSIVTTFLPINDTLISLTAWSFGLFLVLHFSRESGYYRHLLEQTGKRRPAYRGKKTDALPAMLSVSTSAQLSAVAAFLILMPTFIFYAVHWFPGLILLTLSGLGFPYLIIFSLHSNDSDSDQAISLGKLFRALKPFTATLSFSSLSFFWFTLFVSDLIAKFYPGIIWMAVSTFLMSLSAMLLINLACKIFVISERKLSVKRSKTDKAKDPKAIYAQENLSSLDTDIDQALKIGQYDKVVALLETALKRNSSSNLRRQQLFLLLYEQQDLEKLSRYAELFLEWMIERNKVKEASQFIYLLRKHDPAFLIHHLKLMAVLAKHFLRAKKYALVLWLAEEAKTRHSPSEDLASLYLSAAQTLITHYKDLAKAEEYLLFVLNTCGEFASADAAKSTFDTPTKQSKEATRSKN